LEHLGLCDVLENVDQLPVLLGRGGRQFGDDIWRLYQFASSDSPVGQRPRTDGVEVYHPRRMQRQREHIRRDLDFLPNLARRPTPDSTRHLEDERIQENWRCVVVGSREVEQGNADREREETIGDCELLIERSGSEMGILIRCKR
jgi:hypothetical protein